MRRKQYLVYVIAIFGIFGTAYGGYMLVWHYAHGNGIKPLALVLLILGLLSLGFFIAVLISHFIANKKEEERAKTIVKETKDGGKEKEIPEVEDFEEVPQPKEESPTKEEPIRAEKGNDPEYVRNSRDFTYINPTPPTIYVRLVGYGPVLRIEGSRLLDMRNNTYYRIERNIVYQEGYGPRYEINGNQIRDAFGGYLYELSGNNINKVFGGFYASISGSYITLYDQSRKYEISDSLSNKQILALAALLFNQ